METNQAARLKNATTMVRAFILNAESKSDLDICAKAMESAIHGAVIDAQNMLTVKCMGEGDEDDGEEIMPNIPQLEEDIEEPEEEKPEEKRHRGRPTKNPTRQA